jgi:phosphoribosylformylglycinamidine synthase I
MRREDIRVAVMRIEGTNMEEEAAAAFTASGVVAETVHLKQLEGRCPAGMRRALSDYSMLVIPGGFSAGDYVRAGAIFAARIKSSIAPELLNFIDEGRPVLGICNGFQVLVELGILPSAGEKAELLPRAALATNISTRYECRPAFLKNVKRGNSIFTSGIQRNAVIAVPTAHGEGKLTFPPSRSDEWVSKLEELDEIVFRYVDSSGNFAGYPWNPNGSVHDIAGVTDDTGFVLGMMPHPERTYWRHLHTDWTRDRGSVEARGDGSAIIESAISYIERKF